MQWGVWRKRVLIGVATCGLVGVGLVLGIEEVDGFGAWLAETGRSVAGPDAIAAAEEDYYAVADRLDQWRFEDAPPAAIFNGTPEVLAGQNGGASGGVAAGPSLGGSVVPARRVPVADFPPPIPTRAAAGDGHWTPWAAGPADVSSPLACTTVHPDADRSQAAVAIVAIDLERVELHSVPGTREPTSEALRPRPGTIPPGDVPRLVAAFNGGWEYVHGHYGMRVGAITLVPPQLWGCAIAGRADGSITIGSWSALRGQDSEFEWIRQTPPCLVEGGHRDAQLDNVDGRRWGTAIGGAAIVRRSAIGIDASGKVLYYAAGDSLSARAITVALEAAGASSAAILDINYSFPRFLTYLPDAPRGAPGDPIVEGAIMPSLAPAASLLKRPPPPTGVYLDLGAAKDFFYLTARPAHPAFTALTAAPATP